MQAIISGTDVALFTNNDRNTIYNAIDKFLHVHEHYVSSCRFIARGGMSEITRYEKEGIERTPSV